LLQLWIDIAIKTYDDPFCTISKFRHGEIHHGIKRAEAIADYKAVGMNVMHANLRIADQICSRMRDKDVREGISSLFALDSKIEEMGESKMRLPKEFHEWEKCAPAHLKKAPRAGLEPATHRLTAGCSAD
jgi:hypothetical protein